MFSFVLIICIPLFALYIFLSEKGFFDTYDKSVWFINDKTNDEFQNKYKMSIGLSKNNQNTNIHIEKSEKENDDFDKIRVVDDINDIDESDYVDFDDILSDDFEEVFKNLK